MNWKLLSTTLALVLAATGTAIGITRRTASPQDVVPETPQSPYPTWIPADLLDNYGTGGVRRAFQRGGTEIRTAHKSVTMQWFAGSEANLNPALCIGPSSLFDTPTLTEEYQEFTTRYYPLTSAILDSERVLVAGVETGGVNIFEVWQFAWPEVMPAPPVSTTSTEPQAVNVVFPRRTVTRIYHASEPGRNFVRNLTAVRRSGAPPSTALVQFNDSLDMYLIDVVTGQLTLLASGTVSTGLLGQVPQLQAQYYNHLYTKEHVSAGYVYLLTDQTRRNFFSETPPAVLFFDSDKDGVLDNHAVVPAADFFGVGKWSDRDVYVEWWK